MAMIHLVNIVAISIAVFILSWTDIDIDYNEGFGGSSVSQNGSTPEPPPILALFSNQTSVWVPVYKALPDISAIDFCPSSASAMIGIWALYSEADYAGNSSIIYAGSNPSCPPTTSLTSNEWKPSASTYSSCNIGSVKPLEGQIILYEGANYTGKDIIVTRTVQRLGDSPYNFNDKTSSVRVISGKWGFYQSYNCGGKDYITPTGGPDALNPIPNVPDNTLSSVKFIPEA